MMARVRAARACVAMGSLILFSSIVARGGDNSPLDLTWYPVRFGNLMQVRMYPHGDRLYLALHTARSDTHNRSLIDIIEPLWLGILHKKENFVIFQKRRWLCDLCSLAFRDFRLVSPEEFRILALTSTEVGNEVEELRVPSNTDAFAGYDVYPIIPNPAFPTSDLGSARELGSPLDPRYVDETVVVGSDSRAQVWVSTYDRVNAAWRKPKYLATGRRPSGIAFEKEKLVFYVDVDRDKIKQKRRLDLAGRSLKEQQALRSRLLEEEAENGGYWERLRVEGDIVFLERKAQGPVLFGYLSSKDTLESIQDVRGAESACSRYAVTMSPQGELFLVYVQRGREGVSAYLTRSGDRGESWGRPLSVLSTRVTVVGIDLVLNRGLLWVSIVQQTEQCSTEHMLRVACIPVGSLKDLTSQ